MLHSSLHRAITILFVGAPMLLHGASITVINPSFQADDFPAFPGYVGFTAGDQTNPAAITGWTGTGGHGINGIDIGAGVPFADNGIIPDNTRVAFIQNVGSLSQELSGFNLSDLYWIQVFANGRGCCGDVPTVSVSIGATTLLPETVLPPKELGGARTQPYYFFNLPWTADVANAPLTISSRNTTGADASATFDGISVIQRTTADVVIANPSFEAAGLHFPFPGYTPNVAGWTRGGAGGNIAVNGTAANLSGNPFANNGIVPEGDNVVALQQAVTLEQTVTLVPGQAYRFSLDYNARAGDLLQPEALFMVDGLTAFSGPVTPVEAINSFSLPYYRVSFDFTATDASAVLSLANVRPAPDDSTLLIDNVRLIAVPEPSSAVLIGFGVIRLGLRRRRRKSVANC